MSWKETENDEKKLNQQLNLEISNAFLEFYVDLFG
jgi:hypothetical protein